ncbi:MAG: tRNA (N6-isopentenyl adenosine(37)-C2)-methylthiotransferase MiaB [Candidatus Nitrospinota bacterium M3_3B_026]
MEKRKKLSIITLGCQMNKHDSEWISGLLADGYDYTDDHSEADLLVVNTCTVREKAESKFFSLLGRLRPLKLARRDMVIGVAGCIAQDQGERIVEREPMVDLVFGTRAVANVPMMLERLEETGRPQVDTSDAAGYDEFPMRRESAFAAWVSIMRGCDNHCSYCIVPHTRGPEQSRPPESVLREVEELADSGFKEINLLGQNVNSYGRGLRQAAGFPELLRMVDAVGGVERVRFVTSHPKDLSDGLVDAMAELKTVCPALHLPIQSGSDRILSLMRRGYTADHYFSRVERLRERIPDISLTSDMIVGFPGETEEDFEKTLEAVQRAEYDNIFLFKYSPRPGTEAAGLPGRVAPEAAQERFNAVMELQKRISAERYARWAGREVEVLVEGPSKKNPERYSGRTPGNLVVNFNAAENFTGETIRVNIVKSGRYSLEGSIGS